MKSIIATFIAECDTCQRQKAKNIAQPGLLQPLPIPQGKWQDIAMDFIADLPPSASFDSIWVVIDRLTKYAHFIPVNTSYTAPRLAKIYLQSIFWLHGFPSSIVCDRDPKFTSSFWQELFRASGTTFNMSSAYHPQTDGQSEVLNKTLETYLRYFASEQQQKWTSWLALSEYWYNSSYHSAI